MKLVSRAACPVCGAQDRRTLLSRPFSHPSISDFLARYYEGRARPEELDGAPFELAKCGDCGLLYQVHIPDSGSMAELYEEWISETRSLDKKRLADVSLPAGYARQLEAVCRLLGRRPHQISVLDLGMGWGRWCLVARAYGFEVTGLELSERRAAHGRAQGLRVAADLDEIPDGSIDFVNAEQVFEHLAEPRETLRAVRGKLAPGGLARISVPEGRGAERALRRPGWRARHDALHPLEHVNCFTHESLLRLAAEAGLEKIRQPSLPGQGLYGKSWTPGLLPWLKSVIGRPYRQHFGTTLFLRARPG